MIALTNGLITGNITMNKLLPMTASLAALGLLLVGGTHVAAAAPKKVAGNAYECFTDDGYGRKRPCAAGYMQKRADSKDYDCFTDDGHGRKLPGTFRVKR
jgi:hypothetical protein